MESGLEWKEEVDDVAVLELEHREEGLANRFTEETILHRRQPHNRCREHRIAPVSDGCDMQNRVFFGE